MPTDTDIVDSDNPSEETPLYAPEAAISAAVTAASIAFVAAAGYGIFKGGQKVVAWVRPRLPKKTVAPDVAEPTSSGPEQD